ncbi:MAG: hypothetical protein OIF48_10000 [Silicimonas sp.]|nr:hypothetical protein [Silicimonas sp.]
MTLAAPLAAQQMIAECDARLGAQDRVNSRGQPLGSVCAVVQQDRANVHRFGKRDGLDLSDPLFGDPKMRKRIMESCRLAPGYAYLQESVFNGTGHGIVVRGRVFNRNGTLEIVVSERAG